MNTFREWLTFILACMAIAVVITAVLPDFQCWFEQTLIGKFVAALILAVVVGCVWVGGVIHGMGQCDD